MTIRATIACTMYCVFCSSFEYWLSEVLVNREKTLLSKDKEREGLKLSWRIMWGASATATNYGLNSLAYTPDDIKNEPACTEMCSFAAATQQCWYCCLADPCHVCAAHVTAASHKSVSMKTSPTCYPPLPVLWECWSLATQKISRYVCKLMTKVLVLMSSCLEPLQALVQLADWWVCIP